MKRLHLFEFEDFDWFPAWLRVCMTRYLAVIHKLLGSGPTIARLLDVFLKRTSTRHILDLCSGSGGPMEEVYFLLKTQYGFDDLHLVLSDKYPDHYYAERIQNLGDPDLTYKTMPVEATGVSPEHTGLRTLICGLHHMKPAVAKIILKNAQTNNQPIFIYEISANTYPSWLWWLPIPINVLTVFVLTPLVRPFSWQQLVFTYLIPILPLLIAWDGAVSNARTYTLKDLDLLLEGLPVANYTWEKQLIKGKAGPKIYLKGIPQY